MQQIIVNSHFSVIEEYTYDNWNGGTYGHAVIFRVPSSIYYDIFEAVNELEDKLCKGINRLCPKAVENEHIAEVSLELEDDQSVDGWRENSGALIQKTSIVSSTSDEDLHRLWDLNHFRLFLSHKSDYKKKASDLKDELGYYGVSCFVAHEDIEPRREWQREIEKALFSMDALVAMMTPGFSDSKWTDHEIGVAIGREVLVVPVRLGTDPYGLIGKYQALSGVGKDIRSIAGGIYDLLWRHSSLRPSLIESLVVTFEKAKNVAHADSLMAYLDRIDFASPDLIARLEEARIKNDQVRGAFEVQAKLPLLIDRLRNGAPVR